MAQPYQDLQGNWFIAGRPMSAEDRALYSASQPAVIPEQIQAPTQIAPQAQAPIRMAPKAPTEVDPLVQAMQNAQEKKRIGLNPFGAAFSQLFGNR